MLDIDRLHNILASDYHPRGTGKTTARLVQVVGCVQTNPDIELIVGIVTVYNDIDYLLNLLHKLKDDLGFTLKRTKQHEIYIDNVRMIFVAEGDEYKLRGLKDYLLMYLRHWD